MDNADSANRDPFFVSAFTCRERAEAALRIEADKQCSANDVPYNALDFYSHGGHVWSVASSGQYEDIVALSIEDIDVNDSPEKTLAEKQNELLNAFKNEPTDLHGLISEIVFDMTCVMYDEHLWDKYHILDTTDPKTFMFNTLLPWAWDFEYWWKIETADRIANGRDYLWTLEDVLYRRLAETFGNKEEE